MAKIEPAATSIKKKRLADIQSSAIAFKERRLVIFANYLAMALLAILGGLFIWSLTKESRFQIWITIYCFIVAALFISAARQPANRAQWPYLLANKESIFIPSSSNGEFYTEIPWRAVRSCRIGEYSLNIRGIVIEINVKKVNPGDLKVMEFSLRKNNAGEHEVATPTGTLDRITLLKNLATINPELNIKLDRTLNHKN